MTVDRKADDAQFIDERAGWPMWPALPVKRLVRDDWPEIGFLHDTGEAFTLYHGNLFKCADDGELPEKFETFANGAEIVAAGWYVD